MRTLDWNQIRVGDAVSPLRIDVTATVVVAGAIATRHFMPVHPHRHSANPQGSPEIFMNIMTDNAYCSRFLTDWAGPEAMVKRIAIRLGVPAHAGSQLQFTRSVHGTARLGAEGIVAVEFRATNDKGDHLSGTAVLSLPLAEATT